MRNLRKNLANALLTCIALAGLSGLGAILYFESQLPNIHSIEDYRPQTGTKIYSDDGYLVAHLARERRSVVPISEIPNLVKYAFLAAEDSNFYQHQGLDYFGILRAFLKNLRPGAHRQGASTITQQTVKTLIVGAERSYSRKIREALLARQLEQLLSKDEILHLYLNQIYFGVGAHGRAIYGVEEASQNFFGKSVSELDVGEAAFLSAIPKNPSRYTVLANPQAAKVRQEYVLEQMVKNNWITPEQANNAIESPVSTPQSVPPFLGKAPHYVEFVRRRLLETYSEEKIYGEGLTVYTGLNAQMQWAAHQSLRHGLEQSTKRQGFPGASIRIEVDSLKAASKHCHQELTRRLKKRRAHPQKEYANQIVVWDLRGLSQRQIATRNFKRCRPKLRELKSGLRVTALVKEVNPQADDIVVDLGTTDGVLSLQSLKWARAFSPTTQTPSPHSVSQILNTGDVVTVQISSLPIIKGTDSLPKLPVELIPEPKLQVAIVAIDPHSRLVRAIVGGYKLNQSGFLRATQALRQPGSAFKPIVYASGIENKVITPASICTDSPVVIRDQWTGKAWKPENYEDGRYDGNITYRVALSKSKNTCSVKLVERLTPDTVIKTAQALGISSKQPNNLTIGLGTGEVTPLELANTYATFASGGYFAEPITIRKIVDSDGTVLEQTKIDPKKAVSPGTAFVINHMLTSVVQEGTGVRARKLGRTLAGKTGTTNQSRNAWFAGFSPELVSVVWVGFDDNSSMGKLTGSSAALPIWVDFMDKALRSIPKTQFTPPPDVVFRRVDRHTGEPTDDEGGIEEVFLPGTEPQVQSRELPSLFIEDQGP